MSPPAPGRIFGPYELVASIGAGGMGEVWKARDTGLDRTVAMKFSKVQFSERFEARGPRRGRAQPSQHPEALFAYSRTAGSVISAPMMAVTRDGSRILAVKEVAQPEPGNVIHVMTLPR